jgi:CRISPR-associated protein Cas5d
VAFRLLIRGDRACFRRPEFGADLVTYDAMPPAAARTILQAIHGPPSIRWAIENITILHPIRSQWSRVDHRGAGTRRANILVDVGYLVTASFELTAAADPADTAAAHAGLFRRRVRQGRYHHPPFLGLTEFPAAITLLEKDDNPPVSHYASASIDLGWMIYDTRNGQDRGSRFFRASAVAGTIVIPPVDSNEIAS